MAQIIEARAVISAEDKTGAIFEKLAAKFDKLGKSFKSQEQLGRLVSQLKGAEAQLKAIDKFNVQRGLLSDARTRFRDAQANIERAAKAMSAAEKPTRALEAAYRQAQNTVRAASRAFEEQSASVLATKRILETAGTPINKFATEQQRLRRVVEHTTDALRVQNKIVHASPASHIPRRAPEKGGETAKTVGALVAPYGAARVVKHAVEQGAEFEHERVRMETAGMTPEEIKSAEHEATQLTKKYSPVSKPQILHTLRNARSVTGSYHEAAEIADPLLALRVVAEGAHPEKAAELNADFDKLVKGMELKGVTQDKKKFEHYIDNMAKAVNVFGDTLRPTDYYESFKYGRDATNAMSDDYALSTAPTLAQELGGSSAGKANASFYRQFVGGKMSNRAVAQLEKYKMLDPKKVIKTKTGNVKGVLPGGIVGGEYLKPGSFDPYLWVNKVLLPHLKEQGITDPAEVQEVIAAMASQQTAGQMMAIYATQQQRIEKDKALIKGAKGIEAAPIIMRKDPKIGYNSLATQANNVFQSGTSPVLHTAAPYMDAAAKAMSEVADAGEKHPKVATTVAAGLVTGMLMSAMRAAGYILPMFSGVFPEVGVGGAVLGTLRTGAKWGARGGAITGAAITAYDIADYLWMHDWSKNDRKDDPLKASYDAGHPKDTIERLRAERDARDARRPSRVGLPSVFDSPEVPGIPHAGQLQQVQITGSAEVRGETTIKVEVTASSELLRAYEQSKSASAAMHGTLNANGPGSVGKSSPDASSASTGPQ